jgi:hypothetical protein
MGLQEPGHDDDDDVPAGHLANLENAPFLLSDVLECISPWGIFIESIAMDE